MGLLKSRKTTQIDRRASLSGIPFLNESVVIERIDGIPMALKRVIHRGNGFLERFRPPVMERRYELDEFGAFVVHRIDGKKSVLDLINAFEDRFKMSHRESELGVVAFIKMLMKRNLLAVGIAKEREGASS